MGKSRKNEHLEDQVISIDTLTFLVPARNFRVEGTLLKGGYVSLATEFALRLLRDAGELPPGEVGAFFGFAERETRALIQELLIDGYVDISSDRVRLSTRGENAFNPASGELEALDIEAFADTVPLDLISFSPVDTAGGARMPWLSELEIKDKTAAAAATSAGEHGFRTNFGEWRDRKFKGGSASMVRLQTMDVTPLARFTTPISVPVNYAPSISDAIEPDFSKLRDKGRRGSREKLIDALSQALRGIAAPTDQYAAAEITARWDNGILKSASTEAGSMLLAWLQAAATGVDDLPSFLAPSLRLGGTMMTECSIEKISDFIKTLEPSEDERNHVFWLPAVHAAWGRSAYLIDVVRALSGDPNDERSLVFLPRADKEERTRRDFIRSYGPSRDGRSRPLFNTCVAIAPDALPMSLELVLQPKRWAVCMIHAPSSTGYPVPVGYVTANPDALSAIGDLVGSLVSAADAGSVFWAPADQTLEAVISDIERSFSVVF